MRILSQCQINPFAALYLPNPYYSLVKLVKAELCNRLLSKLKSILLKRHRASRIFYSKLFNTIQNIFNAFQYFLQSHSYQHCEKTTCISCRKCYTKILFGFMLYDISLRNFFEYSLVFHVNFIVAEVNEKAN